MPRPVPTIIPAAFLFVAGAAHAQTYSNTTPITLLDNRPASLYPSPIQVSGATESIGTVRVTLHGVSHTYVGDIAAILIAPDGRVFRYQTTDKVTLFPPDASSGASLLNPVELGLPAMNYYDALRRTLRTLGVSDRTVRFIAATGGVTFEER